MNMCPSYKRKVPPESCLKGQIFFIFSNQPSQQIVQERIFRLGGRVDNFLNKDITTVLVEDSHLLCPEFQINDLNVRPIIHPNNTAAANFAHPNLVYNLPSTSRGYNFLASFVQTPAHRVICFARQWGIQILGIGYFLATTDTIVNTVAPYTPQPKKSHNVSNLTGCYIKVECYHKKFRPCYKVFSSNPDCLMPLKNANILIKPENCNVILDKPASRRQLQYNPMDRGNRTAYNTHDARQPLKVNEKKFNNKLKPKEVKNYCECCKSNFTDLKLHIKSANHQKFVADEKNYETVNNILKMLPSAQEFIQKQRKPSFVSNITLQNGEVAHHRPEKSIVEVDLVSSPIMPTIDSPMPLNLHIKAYPDNPSPLNLHVPRDKAIAPSPHMHLPHETEISLSPHLQSPMENEVAVSPHLHLARDKDIDASPPNMTVHHNIEIKQELTAVNISMVKNEITNPAADMDFLNVGEFKDDPTDRPESGINPIKNDDLPEEPAADDPLSDKNNPPPLKHLLNNFDSYWLDTLPNEVEDIIFDDNIFGLDESLPKGNSGDPNQETEMMDNFSPYETVPIPDDLKTQPTVDPLMAVKTDTEDVLESGVNVQDNCSPVCKMEENYDNPLSSPATLKVNEALPSNKRISFSFTDVQNQSSIAPYFQGKPDPYESPSCSKGMPNKSNEQMFSSDSSDSENGNVFISNVLNTITFNSDSEMRVDRESSCEEPPAHRSKMLTPKKRRQGYLHKVEEICASPVKQTPVIEAKLNVSKPSHSDSNIVHSSNVNPVGSIEHPNLSSASVVVKPKSVASSVIEHKPSKDVRNDVVNPDSTHIYNTNHASIPAAVEHFPVTSSRKLLSRGSSSASLSTNTDCVSTSNTTGPSHVQNTKVKDVSSQPEIYGLPSSVKHTAKRSTDKGYLCNIVHTPTVNSELMSSAELTPASSVEHTPARNGEFAPVSTVEPVSLNYTEYPSVNYAVPTPVSNSERTPEAKPVQQCLSNAELAILNSAKQALMNNPDYSMISSADYSNPEDSGLPLAGKISEGNVESAGKDNYEPTYMMDTDQGYVSKPDPPEPACSNVQEIGCTAQVSRAPINAPERTSWRNQESVYMPNPKRARVDYHSVSSLIAQPPAEEPKSKKIPHKKSVQRRPKLPPLYSVSILPGNGLKLRFTCHSRNTSQPDAKKVLNRYKRQ